MTWREHDPKISSMLWQTSLCTRGCRGGSCHEGSDIHNAKEGGFVGRRVAEATDIPWAGKPQKKPAQSAQGLGKAQGLGFARERRRLQTNNGLQVNAGNRMSDEGEHQLHERPGKAWQKQACDDQRRTSLVQEALVRNIQIVRKTLGRGMCEINEAE
jgi:hypothetical protein